MITAEGRGLSPSDVLEAGYSYKWSGDGANSQTTDTLTINSLDRKIDVLCTVKGNLRLYAAGRSSADAAKAYYTLPEALTSGQMTIQFDYLTTVANPNTAVSLVHSGAAANADVVNMNALVRFNTGIGAYNGTAWGADKISSLQVNKVYHVKITIDMTTKTYSVWATPEGGSEIEIATNFAFRAKDPANIAELRVLDTRNSGNNGATRQMWIENITVSKKPELTVLLNGEPHPDISTMEFVLKQGDDIKATGVKNGYKVIFNEQLNDGIYDIYVNGANTNIKLTINNGGGSATIDLGTDESRARKALQELITTIEGRGLKEDRYTPATWTPFATALAEAKDLLADDAALAAALNTALSNLSSAYEALALIPRASGIYKAAYADRFGGPIVRTNLGNTSNGATYPNGSYSSPPAGQPNDRSVLGGFHTGSDPQTYRAKPGAGVTFSVKRGEIFGFLGPNGAGKTTTLRMLTTLLPIDAGKAAICGYDLMRQPQEVRRHIGYVSQLGGADLEATGRENLILAGRLYGTNRHDAEARATELLAVFELTGLADRAAKTYSGGQKRRLEIALGMINRPEVLFLDEPTTGLDPQNRANLWEQIRRLQEGGTTIFLTTHYLDEADALSNRLAIMDHGKIVAEGTPHGKRVEGCCDVFAAFSYCHWCVQLHWVSHSCWRACRSAAPS